jgi:hypothetical protein
MTPRENMLRCVRFEHPDWIPVRFAVNASCWAAYPQAALQDLMAAHPLLFPDFTPASEPVRPKISPLRTAGAPAADAWGCVWRTAMDGIEGAVVEHPLADWAALDRYTPPSPEHTNGVDALDWDAIRRRVAAARERGAVAQGSLRHGHTFLLLTYLRGYENVVTDMCLEDPRLETLLGTVTAFNLGLVQRYVDAGVEWMAYPEDLGMQHGPMLAPEQFRRWIRPAYERLTAPARDAGCVIHMHSDGDIRALADDLLAVGFDALNLQDTPNGIDWIAATLKGRVCIDLDLDRAGVSRFGTPAGIHAHVRDAVDRLAGPDGGLMLLYGLYPGVPLENVAAVMDAMEAAAERHA